MAELKNKPPGKRWVADDRTANERLERESGSEKRNGKGDEMAETDGRWKRANEMENGDK